MSLVIAEINKFGVVMAADTAETNTVIAKSGKLYDRIRYGAQKLFPITGLRGGVSYWGAGEIYVDGGSGRLPTDVWLEDFIATERLETLEKFAYTLRRVVNVLHTAERPLLGFQIAGMQSDGSGGQRPVFYRICNHDTKGGRKPEFDVEADVEFRSLERPAIFADGDCLLYLDIQSRIQEKAIQTGRHTIPRSDLDGRAEYQAALVRFISDLYGSANLMRTIGGKVTTLRIPNEGVSRFEES